MVVAVAIWTAYLHGSGLCIGESEQTKRANKSNDFRHGDDFLSCESNKYLRLKLLNIKLSKTVEKRQNETSFPFYLKQGL